MFANCFTIDISESRDFYDEYRDEPTAAELFVEHAEIFIERAKERIRKRVYRLLVWVYAVPVLIGYVAIDALKDALKQKVYEAEAKRGRPFGYSYRVYKGRGR